MTTTTAAQLVRIGTTRGTVDIGSMTAVDELNLLAYRLMGTPATFAADWQALRERSAAAFARDTLDIAECRSIAADAAEPWAAILDAHRTTARARHRLAVDADTFAEVLRLVGRRYGLDDRLPEIAALRALGC